MLENDRTYGAICTYVRWCKNCCVYLTYLFFIILFWDDDIVIRYDWKPVPPNVIKQMPLKRIMLCGYLNYGSTISNLTSQIRRKNNSNAYKKVKLLKETHYIFKYLQQYIA